MLQPKDIITQVAGLYGITPEMMTGPARTNRLHRARMLAAVAIRRVWSDLPLRSIGRLLGGREHSTVGHALQQFHELLPKDQALRLVWAELERLLGLAPAFDAPESEPPEPLAAPLEGPRRYRVTLDITIEEVLA